MAASLEHTSATTERVTWREAGGKEQGATPPSNGKQKTGKPATTPKAKYEVAAINDDVCAVSYLSESGFTLTSVLDFARDRRELRLEREELVPQRGMFEVAERV